MPISRPGARSRWGRPGGWGAAAIYITWPVELCSWKAGTTQAFPKATSSLPWRPFLLVVQTTSTVFGTGTASSPQTKQPDKEKRVVSRFPQDLSTLCTRRQTIAPILDLIIPHTHTVELHHENTASICRYVQGCIACACGLVASRTEQFPV